MAEIKFKGFVQKHEGNRPWEVAEGHRRKVDEQWVTEGTTYHKVWLPRDHSGLTEGDLVEITGTQKTPKKTGDYKPTPVVWADVVTVVRPSTSAAPVAAEPAWDNSETPF